MIARVGNGSQRGVQTVVPPRVEGVPGWAGSYDATSTLLVVDVQNDFADPGGALYVPGAPEILALVQREISRADRAGAGVVYTQDWHPASTPHFAKDGGLWPVHCVAGTWGAELVPMLSVLGPVIRKGQGGEDGYSGFSVRDPRTGSRSPTGLTELLRARDVRKLVIVGLATDYCVKDTALDAVAEGFETTVLTEAVRAVERESGDGERALREMVESGVHLV